MQLEIIIGLEIHAQISTQSKMFSAAKNSTHGMAPNTAIDPVSVGHPGALPVPNREAILKGARAAMALGCAVRPKSKFDRKNYFYPDLPFGYQISQFDEPLAENGAVEIVKSDGSRKTIRITRLHLENDAGKLTHIGEHSLLDFNRAGCPLMEIVSEPDIRDAEEARLYAESVQKIVQYADASDADMYRGEMRFDASVSLRPAGEDKLYPRAEIKNLNSFRALESAIKYEIARQREVWEAGNPPSSQQTVGWDDETGATYLLREKESAADYRYFPEPDIPPITFSESELAEIRAQVPELPLARAARLIRDFGLTEQEAVTLTSSRELADYFESAAAVGQDGKKVASWILSELLAKMNEAGLKIAEQKVRPELLGELVQLIISGEISGKIAKDIFPEIWETGKSPKAIVAEKGLKQVSDTGAIEKIIDEMLAANESVVADYRGGKQNAFGFLVGQAMKASRGQANPSLVNALLKKKLG